jgi:hypothetical protein
MIRGAIEVKVAEFQRDAAQEALTWAKVVAVSVAVATIISLIAFLVAVL